MLKFSNWVRAALMNISVSFVYLPTYMFLIHMFEQARCFPGCGAGWRRLQSPIFSVTVAFKFKCTWQLRSRQRRPETGYKAEAAQTPTSQTEAEAFCPPAPGLFILAHPDWFLYRSRPRRHLKGDCINKVCPQSANPVV